MVVYRICLFNCVDEAGDVDAKVFVEEAMFASIFLPDDVVAKVRVEEAIFASNFLPDDANSTMPLPLLCQPSLYSLLPSESL